jgi:hypothetical protein
MLDGWVGVGSDRLKNMHLVLLAFKGSWRAWKESCMALKLIWRLVNTVSKEGQMYTEWCCLRRGGSENKQQQVYIIDVYREEGRPED